MYVERSEASEKHFFLKKQVLRFSENQAYERRYNEGFWLWDLMSWDLLADSIMTLLFLLLLDKGPKSNFRGKKWMIFLAIWPSSIVLLPPNLGLSGNFRNWTTTTKLASTTPPPSRGECERQRPKAPKVTRSKKKNTAKKRKERFWRHFGRF